MNTRKFASCLLASVAVITMTSCGGNDSVAVMYPANKAKEVNIDTRLRLTFADAPVLGGSGFVRVYDAKTGEIIDSLDLSLPSGLTESRTYGPDCDYTKVPYDYSRTFVPTNRNTVPGTPSGGAEPTPRDMQLNIIGGFTDGFRFHPILIRGNSAVVYLHNNVLEYGRTYYVTIDKEVIDAEGFEGIAKGEWKFRTKAAGPDVPEAGQGYDPKQPSAQSNALSPSNGGQDHEPKGTESEQGSRSYRLTVNCDGSGDFSTLQGALDAVPDWCKDTVFIDVAAGDYEEIVYVRNKSNIVITGAGKDSTRIHYANNEVFNPHPMRLKTNEKKGTFPERRAASAFDNCSDIILRDICFATDLTGQAEGLLVNGDRIALYDVRIVGSGDALQANGTVYMEGCEVIGSTDTILGRGTLFAYRTTFKNDGGPFTWVRNFRPAYGDIFVECHFEGTPEKYATFGRSGKNRGNGYPDAEIVLINCTTRYIDPVGFGDYSHESASLLEFNTRDADTGLEVDYSRRHPWSRRLNPSGSAADSLLYATYTDPAAVLSGWIPERP